MACCICHNQEKCPYKCPVCRAPYCSLSCCKSHKAVCRSTTASASDREKDDKETSIDVATSTNNDASKDTTYPSSTEILQPTQLDALLNSVAIRSVLKSVRLRKDLFLIDKATKREEALRQLRTKNPEFESFVQLMLETVADRK